MQIQVFVQNESGSNQKNLHDEKKLKFKKAVIVSRRYPYPYGFILNTTSEFVSHVFDHVEGKVIKIGSFFGRDAVVNLIRKYRDK